jgi:trans-aconitate 2-methyltransferase
MSEVVEFYDNFSSRQSWAGINNRHLSIQFHLEKAGLKKNHKVLEVGCGIGTVSHLILRTLSGNGTLHAIDISPKSIALAKELNARYSNAIFEVLDLTKETIDDKFDIVVLPDVIEHIPFELYSSLFSNLSALLKDNGFIFIHIPHPNYLEWLIRNGSKELQIIDNPVYTDKLLSIVYPLGLYVHYLKSYSVYSISDDYQIIVLKKRSAESDFKSRNVFFESPLHNRIIKKISYLLRGRK